MRKLSIAMVIASLILPACLDLERMGCIIFSLAFMVVSILMARKFAPDIFV